ncbi:hypothetical protein J4Q44_G00387020, partial [Coregonus suidteri]
YFYLLENLAWVKSYNICFELEDCNEIFIQLFKTLFSVINNSHNQKVQMHMLDLMSSIIMEGDGVTQELLDTILINLIPAHKNLNKQAYDLAKTLLKRTVQTIETCIANFFNQVLVMGKSSVSDLSEHVFDLIQELFSIEPLLLTSVMPQLEFKLKSNDGEERLAVVRLLAKLFGAKDSELATQNRPLWQCFLGRFNDIHVPVRLESVKFASHCLMNHPDLAKDLTEFLKVRSHDPEEAIRHDVIVTIINAGKKDLNLVNDQLLGFVRERTLDKRWRVRKEAMMGLAQLFKKYCLHHEAGKEQAQKISWIKDKLLHIYYQNSIDDKLLVEKIFAQYMVPHSLDTEEKMKCLYYLYACLDTNAVKALNEMWKCQNMLRGLVRELLDLHKLPASEANTTAMFGKLMTISKNLPDAGKAQDFMKRFNQVLGEDEKLRVQLDTLISPVCSCKQAELCVREITRKLTFPKQPTNPFLEMVKFLLERIAPVHIDSEAISALVKLLNKSIEGTADDDDEGVTPDTAIRSGLELLKVLSFTHPTAFHSAETYESLLQCLKMEDDKVAEAAIQIFRNTGQKIETELQQIRSTLIPVLHQKAKRGTPHQAKQAVHCIHAIFCNKEVQLAQIFEPLSRSLNADVPEQLITPLVSLGHISLLAPDQFASPMKAIVANFIVIVKDLLMNDRSVGNKNGKLWTSDEEVSPEVLAKVQAIKLLPCWSPRETSQNRRRSVSQTCLACVWQQRRHHEAGPGTRFTMTSSHQNSSSSVDWLSTMSVIRADSTHTPQCLHDPKARQYIHTHTQCPDSPKANRYTSASPPHRPKRPTRYSISPHTQCPDDPKANEKLYIVCDVALFVIVNKSTACHLDSPKDPVLPTKFYTPPDKDFINDKEYLSSEVRTVLLTGKPKPSPVLSTVNKALTVPGRRVYIKTAGSDTTSNTSTNSQPSSPATKTRDVVMESSESGARENEENPVITKTDDGKKEDTATSDLTTGASPVPKPRRGRPPKVTPSPLANEKEGGAGKGRKRAAPAQDSAPSGEPNSIKMPKAEDVTQILDLQR